MNKLPEIGRHQRAIVAGQTGSGKSMLARWLLLRSAGHWVILNPKWTAAFNDMPDSQIIKGIDFKKITKSISENRFTIVNPLADENNYTDMDDLIYFLHTNFSNVGLCVDELYMIHSTSGRPGQGLIGWLTRGRELKQPFLGLTQRPAWISRFLFSEADFIGNMALNLPEDRKKIYETVGHPAVKDKLAPYYWYWYAVAPDKLRRFAPIPIDKSIRKE